VRDLLRHAWRVTRKDLRLEFRSRTALTSALVFTALVLVVFEHGRDPTAVPTLNLALNRAFQAELENQALDGLLLAPISRTSLFWGKLGANLVFVALVQVAGMLLFMLFFNVPVWRVWLPLATVTALATVGFIAVGTLFSAMVVRTRFAELMLPVLLIPFLLPPLIAAVQVTAQLFAGRPLSEVAGWLRLLAAYDVCFVTLATLLFPFTVTE
jgi:heme exporter protein B